MNQYSELARKYSTRSATRNNFIWRRLMLASVSALAVSTASTPVMAQCEPDPPEDGDEVICEGVDDDGFSINAFINSLRIEVLPGSEINGDLLLPGTSDNFDNLGNALFNRGIIDGSVLFGIGNDLFANGDGVVNGSVNLGDGNDIFVLDLDAENPSGIILGQLHAGVGEDSIAYFTDGISESQISLPTGFERILGIAHTDASVLTLHGDLLTNQIDVTGLGTIVVDADLAPPFVPQNSSFGAEQGAISVIGNPIDSSHIGSTLVLNGDITVAGDINAVRVLVPNTTIVVSPNVQVRTNGADGIVLNSHDGLLINRGIISGIGGRNGLVSFNETSRGGDRFRNTGLNEGIIIAEADESGSGSRAVTLNSAVQFFRNEEGALIRSFVRFAPAVDTLAGFSGQFENGGEIISDHDIALSIFGFFQDQAQLTNEISGLIEGQIGLLFNNGAIRNDGVIRGTGFVQSPQFFESTGEGAWIFGASLINGPTGLIQASHGIALRAQRSAVAPSIIENFGNISGGGIAVGGEFFSLSNYGAVTGDIISTDAGPQPASFNTLSNELISNFGSIDGQVFLGTGADSFTNSGAVAGSVNLGFDQDVFRALGGTVNGVIDLGGGDDFFLVQQNANLDGIFANVVVGEGFDSFGYSVDGVQTITLQTASGFDGVAVESLSSESVATIENGNQPLATTLSLFGDGTIVNQQNINVNEGPAVLLFSNFSGESFPGFDDVHFGPFGDGVTLINNADLLSATGVAIDVGINSMGSPNFGGEIRYGSGNDEVQNHNLIFGDIILRDGDDSVINSGTIEGDLSFGSGRNYLQNLGVISGNIEFTEPDEDTSFVFGSFGNIVINAGSIDGDIKFTNRADFYLTDFDSASAVTVGSIAPGNGFDSIGYYTDGSVSGALGVSGDFEAAGLFVDGASAQFEISGIAEGQLLPFLRVLGNGRVINNTNIVSSFDDIPTFFEDVPTVDLVSDGVTFENYGNLDGVTAIGLNGNAQTAINNADLIRTSQPGDSTASTGFIYDGGIGNTFVNNASIVVDTPFNQGSAIFIGGSTFGPFNPDNALFSFGGRQLPITNVVNNGVISTIGDTFFGRVSVETMSALPIRIENNGFIDRVRSDLFAGGLEVINNGIFESIEARVGPLFEMIPFEMESRNIEVSIRNQSEGVISANLDEFFQATISFNENYSHGSLSQGIQEFFLSLYVLNEQDAIIENSTGGAIRSVSFAGSNSATQQRIFVENYGLIRSAGGRPAIETDVVMPFGVEFDTRTDVWNFGTIVGDVLLGSGDDRYSTNLDASLHGIVDAGLGMDTFSLVIDESGSANEFFFAAIGQDSLYQNFEIFQKDGLGDLIIADAGEIDYTEILRGGLIVERSLTSIISVFQNARLGGNGIVIGDVVNSGVVAPGASIGELTISGDLTLNSNSVLRIEFDSSDNDAITVLGNVLIDDAVLEFTPIGSSVSSIQSFGFLNANSVMGEFSAISFNGFTGFSNLTFANGVLGVTITPQFEFSSSLTANSVSVAGYLNDLIISDAANSNADDVISTLFSLSSDSVALNAAMLSLQPEAFAATAAISVENAFLVNDIIRDRFGTEKHREDGKYFWLSGAGGFANYEGDLSGDGTSSFKTNSRGIIGGAEIVRGDALIGIYGGSVESNQELRTGLSQTEAEGFVAGGYGAWRVGELSNIASIGYVFGKTETDRAVPALSEQLQSDYDFDSFTAQGRSQFDFTVNEFLLSPFVSATYVRSDRGAVVESGGSSALYVSDQIEDFLFLDVGSAIEKQFSINDRTKARAAFSAGWRYEALGHSIDAHSSIGMDGPFNFAGAAAEFDRSRLVVGGDGSVDVGENIVVFAKYRGEFGSDYTSNRVSGGITVQF